MRGKLAALALIGVCSAPLAARAESPRVGRISLEQPSADAAVADAEGSVFLAGRALGVLGPPQLFDVVIAIDTSRSTAAPSGSDVDRDGRLGTAPADRFSDRTSSDPGDSVLAAQIEAARTLLSQLDPSTTRLALLTFAGESAEQRAAAQLRVPLTADFRALVRELDALRAETPRGRTHIAAALELAADELLGAGQSAPRTGAERVVVLLSDGSPTLPFPLDPAANAEHTLAAGRRLGEARIRIDSIAIGQAPEGTGVAQQLAAETGGRFALLGDPDELRVSFEELEQTGLASLEIVNQTSGARPLAESVEGDGRFFAVVPVVSGENWLRIRARSSDGTLCERSLRVLRSDDAVPDVWRERWLEPRRRLLQARLDALRQRRLGLEAEAAFRARRDQLSSMERVRRDRTRGVSVLLEDLPPAPARRKP